VGPALVVLAAGLARRYGGCKPLAPIGPYGEAVIDLLASDAIASGFGRIVLVLHPETGPAVRYHVERCWPKSVLVSYAVQPMPRGTVDAVLVARPEIGGEHLFGVCNADDVYGEAAMSLLVEHLAAGDDRHTLIGYALRSTVSTDDPVTRGICEVDSRGYLTGLTERRRVSRSADGHTFTAEDGRDPSTLPGDLPASVNLWGFRSEIWEVLEEAMHESGLDHGVAPPTAATGDGKSGTEVLLPEVVAAMVSRGAGLPVRVATTDTKLIGVTHAADLPGVSAELMSQVAFGVRPSRLWDGA
jgi:Nucleotidyl transferase